MNLLFTNGDKHSYESRVTNIMAWNFKTGTRQDYIDQLDQYTEFQNTTEEESNYQKADQQLKQAIDNYRAAYRRSREQEYPEKRSFQKLRTEMESDRLFKLLRKAPKGALLHVHSTAGLSFEGLMNMCLRWNINRNAENASWTIMVNIRETTRSMAKYTLLYKYQCSELQKAGDAPVAIELKQFLETEGNWGKLNAAISFTDQIKETADVWREFNIRYSRFNMLFEHEDFYKEYHKNFFMECKEDNIPYVELRCGFESFKKQEDTEQTQMSGEHILRRREDFDIANYLHAKEQTLELLQNGAFEEKDIAFLTAIAEAAKEAQIEVRVILTANRGTDPDADKAKLESKMDLAISIMNNADEKYADLKKLVIGFDFVNQEDKGYSTSAYADLMYEGSKCPEFSNKPRIACLPFYLHDGETSWDMAPDMKWGNDNEKLPNIITGSVCSKYRIGHGLAMVRRPELIDAIAYGVSSQENGEREDLLCPVLEVNPVSNQVLRYCDDLRDHPVLTYMRSGLNCVVCNDDPLILGNPGLSYDCWLLLMETNISYQMLKRMIFTAYVFKLRWKYPNSGPDDWDLVKIGEEFRSDWGRFVTGRDAEEFCRKNIKGDEHDQQAG